MPRCLDDKKSSRKVQDFLETLVAQKLIHKKFLIFFENFSFYGAQFLSMETTEKI